MILKLKCDKERKGAVYKTLTEKVLGEGVEMKVKKLDEITDAEALRQQYEVQVAPAAVRLQKLGSFGTATLG